MQSCGKSNNSHASDFWGPAICSNTKSTNMMFHMANRCNIPCTVDTSQISPCRTSCPVVYYCTQTKDALTRTNADIWTTLVVKQFQMRAYAFKCLVASSPAAAQACASLSMFICCFIVQVGCAFVGWGIFKTPTRLDREGTFTKNNKKRHANTFCQLCFLLNLTGCGDRLNNTCISKPSAIWVHPGRNYLTRTATTGMDDVSQTVRCVKSDRLWLYIEQHRDTKQMEHNKSTRVGC